MGNTQEQVIKYSRAFKETYLIINNLAEELYARIPEKFIKMIKENMSQDYIITLKELQQKGQMEETKIILSLIYRDFLCDEETKKELFKQEQLKIQAEKEKINNIFGNKQQKDEDIVLESNDSNITQLNSSTQEQQALMVIKDEKWYVKILNKIKSIFKFL